MKKMTIATIIITITMVLSSNFGYSQTKAVPMFKYQLPKIIDSVFRKTYRLNNRTESVINKLTSNNLLKNKQKHNLFISKNNIDYIVNNIPQSSNPIQDSIQFHFVLASNKIKSTSYDELDKYDGTVTLICNYIDGDHNIIKDKQGKSYFFIFGKKDVQEIKEQDFLVMKNNFTKSILPKLNLLVSNKKNTQIIKSSVDDFKNFMQGKSKVKLAFAEYIDVNAYVESTKNKEQEKTLKKLFEDNSSGQMMFISDSYDTEGSTTATASKSGYDFNNLCPTKCAVGETK